jgi:hypothetical protein
MRKIILILLAILLATQSIAGEISRVTVRNQNFDIVKVINDKAVLQQFEMIWNTRAKLKSSVNPQWLYKIDIEDKGRGDRWLYDPSGYVQVLSKAKVPLYKIPAPNSFNQMIGAHNQAARPDR